jgi:hypothetical protein
MDPIQEHRLAVSRRTFFRKAGLGLGVPALASLLGPKAFGATGSEALGGRPDLPHFTPKAKRAVWLFTAEGPSQMDLFDWKPTLADMFDKDLPASVIGGQRLTTMTSGQKRFPIAPTKYKFAQHGKSGAWASELMPHTARVVDDLTFVKSMWTEAINHDPGITYICTGNQIPGKASLGSWLSYGLGSENANLPSFVVMTPSWSGRQETQALYNRLWGSGFLPGRYSGVALRAKGDPVLYLSNPDGVEPSVRRRMLDVLAGMNQRGFEESGDPETQTRIAQYEMAYRMQTAVPELTDLSKEPEWVFKMYGPDSRKPGTFAYSCLLSRRLLERGVRFVQLFHRGWDQHGNVAGDLPNQCRDVDQPQAALVQDLKQRGMLDDTLVVWGGEFGRTIYCQGGLTRENYGRDHHPRCFTFWLAGGGTKPGLTYGETDDFSYNIVKNPVHIRELNATVLHLLGIDHERFGFKSQGLDQRLTGVEETRVVKGILA